MKAIELSVAKEFSVTPGGSHRSEGDFSGEEFLETHLLPRFEEAVRAGVTLTVDLDGAAGYSVYFLGAVFGGLTVKQGLHTVEATLTIKSDEEPYLLDEIWEYIREATRYP